MTSDRARRVVRRGFVLLTVLWGVAIAGVLAAFVAASGRDSIYAARNRLHAERAWWLAEGCASAMRAAVDSALRESVHSIDPGAVWRELGSISLPSHDSRCRLSMEPVGMLVDLNGVGDSLIYRALAAVNRDEAADVAVLALADWRDRDSLTAQGEVEAQWYRDEGRRSPPNRPLAHPAELLEVRGFEGRTDIVSFAGVDQGPVSINHAPLAVLRLLPGFGDEAVAVVADRRLAGDPLRDFQALAARLSSHAADSLVANLTLLAELTTFEPLAWTMRSEATSGPQDVTAVVELRLVRGAARAIPVWRRIAWL